MYFAGVSFFSRKGMGEMRFLATVAPSRELIQCEARTSVTRRISTSETARRESTACLRRVMHFNRSHFGAFGNLVHLCAQEISLRVRGIPK